MSARPREVSSQLPPKVDDHEGLWSPTVSHEHETSMFVARGDPIWARCCPSVPLYVSSHTSLVCVTEKSPKRNESV